MIHRSRSIGAKALGMALAASIAVLALPGAASAGHGDRYERRHDRHERRIDRHERRIDRHENRHFRQHRRHGRRHGGHRVIVHGDYCGSNYARHARSHRQQRGYYCEPCGHRFHARDHFHRHLLHDHHVPLWRLPFVIVHSAVGWVFYG